MFQAGRDWQMIIGFFAALCSAASCLAFQICNFLLFLIIFLQDRVKDSLKTRKDLLLVFFCLSRLLLATYGWKFFNFLLETIYFLRLSPSVRSHSLLVTIITKSNVSLLFSLCRSDAMMIKLGLVVSVPLITTMCDAGE